MCGIAGFVGSGDEQYLKNMIQAIQYRGPDHQGLFVKENVGLGHARLSIIDLNARGNQPMLGADKSTAIVFNGEIYNYRELRTDLNKRNRYRFTSESDTEVVLHLYEEYGESCFEYLSGMFAIGIYDFHKRKLILARDRMGKKPLYWGRFGDDVVFASELGALMRHPSVKREIALGALNAYLQHEHVPTPMSMLKGIHKLEPATCAVFEKGEVRKKKYWTLSGEDRNLDKQEAISQLDNLLNNATKARLVSDVPLGVFLSGGIDSSTVAYYAQKNVQEKLKTFSVGFDEVSFDESSQARLVAKHLGTEHHELVLKSSDALELVPRALSEISEPLADASYIPTLLLSEYTRRYVTVALGGDGADELFAGYPTFQADRLAQVYRFIPETIRERLIEKLINSMPVGHDYMSLDFKLKQFVQGMDVDPVHMHGKWLGSYNKSERAKLIVPEIWNTLRDQNVFEVSDQYMRECASADACNKLLYMYLRTYLMDGVMVKVDRASMRYSLEARSPFLDHALVEFVFSLPYSLKLRGMKTKYLLKELMKDKLPREIVARKKKGFGIPIGNWLRGELKEYCEDILSESRMQKIGLFQASYVNRIKQEHFEGRRDHRKKLWTLIAFSVWHARYIEQ